MPPRQGPPRRRTRNAAVWIAASRGRPRSQGMAINRQFPQAHPGCCEQRVGQCGRRRSGPGLTNTPGSLDAWNQMNFNFRRFIDAHHPIIIEVALLNASLGERDLAMKRCSEPKDDASLKLRDNRVWIHHDSAVDRADATPHIDLAMLVNLDFSDRGEIGTKGILNRDTPPRALRQHLTPPRFARDQIQAGKQARRFPQLVTPEPNRVFPGLMRELIHKALSNEDIVSGSNTAPEAGLNT